MREPESLTPLLDQGIIQEVVRPLMSGKEAQVYLVVSDGELRVAKVYKTAHNRSFRQRVEYTEGRDVRNSRTRRAMGRHSRFGRAQDEAAWHSAEVDIIYKLRAAGLMVPEPFNFIDGVLIMELITDGDGEPAPRLADVTLDRESADMVFKMLLGQVVGMLCAGVVHGDFSEFNVLLGQYGPVVIDFPQSVDPSHNQSARKLLVRDVDNLQLFLAHAVPGLRRLPYGQELWELYTHNKLTPETQLTGRYKSAQKKADTEAVLYEVEVAERDARKREEAQGTKKRGRRSRRRGPKQPAGTAEAAATKPEGGKPKQPVGTAATKPEGAKPKQPVGTAATKPNGGKPAPTAEPAKSKDPSKGQGRRRRRGRGRGRGQQK